MAVLLSCQACRARSAAFMCVRARVCACVCNHMVWHMVRAGHTRRHPCCGAAMSSSPEERSLVSAVFYAAAGALFARSWFVCTTYQTWRPCNKLAHYSLYYANDPLFNGGTQQVAQLPVKKKGGVGVGCQQCGHRLTCSPMLTLC